MTTKSTRYDDRSQKCMPVVLAVAISAATATACSSRAAPEAPTEEPAARAYGNLVTTQSAGPSIVSRTAFLLTRPSPTTDTLTEAASGLATVLLGQSAPKATFRTALGSVVGVGKELDANVDWQTGVQYSYRSDNARHLVMNGSVARNTAATQDIGIDAAKSVFVSAVQTATSFGILPAIGFDTNDIRNSKLLQGQVLWAQTPIENTAEYIFTIPRKINGIEVFDAGFEVWVHRIGQISRVTKFGPTVASSVDTTGNELPNSNGYSFVQTVNTADLDAQIAGQYPKADVKSIGVRYWLLPGETSGIVEPRQMYFVVPIAVVDGRTLHGRGTYVAYSLHVAGQAPAVWPTPASAPLGNGSK